MPAAELDEHLAGCAALRGLGRRGRPRHPPRPAGRGAAGARSHGRRPGRAAPGAAGSRRRGPVPAARHRRCGSALLAVGVAQAGLAWPALASGHGRDERAACTWRTRPAPGTSRLAAAFVAVAAAPRLAAGALPFLGTFAALLVPVTLADLGAGHVHADRAAAHLLLLAGLALVADRRLAGLAGGRTPRRSRRPAGARVRRAPLAPARPARRLAARRRRHGRPGRRPRRRWCRPTPAEGARLEEAPGRGHAASSARASRSAPATPGCSDADGERVDAGDGVGRRRRRSRSRCAAGCPTTGYLVTYRVISADSHPISGRVLLRGRRRRARAGRRGGGPGPDRSGRRGRAAARPLGRLRRPRARRSACRCSRWCAGRPAGRRTGCAGWRRGRRGRGRRRPRSSASCCRAPTPRRRGLGLAVRPVPAGAPRRRPRPAGRCWPGSSWPSRSVAVLLPVWRRGGPPSAARVVAGGRPGRRAGGQHGRDRPPGRRARGRGWPWPSPSCTSPPWPSGSAAWPGCSPRSSGRRSPADDVAAVAAPLLPAGLRCGGRARRQRHRAGGPRGRVADRAVRHHLRLGARRQARAGRGAAGGRRRLPGVGAAAAGRPPAAARCAAQHDRRTRSPRRRRRTSRRPGSRTAAEARGHVAVGERRRARARRCAARCSSRSPSPPSSWRCRPSSSALPPARSAVAQPVDVLLPLQGSAGPSGSVQVSVDPAAAGRQHAARLPLRRHRPADPAGRRSPSASPRRRRRSARWTSTCSRPDRATTSATGWPSPAPAPGPSPSASGSTSSPPPRRSTDFPVR